MGDDVGEEAFAAGGGFVEEVVTAIAVIVHAGGGEEDAGAGVCLPDGADECLGAEDATVADALFSLGGPSAEDAFTGEVNDGVDVAELLGVVEALAGIPEDGVLVGDGAASDGPNAVAGGGEEVGEGGADEAGGAGDGDGEGRLVGVAGELCEVELEGAVSPGEGSGEVACDGLVAEPGTDAAAGEGVFDAIDEAAAVVVDGLEAVFVFPAGEGADDLDIAEAAAGLVVVVLGDPASPDGADADAEGGAVAFADGALAGFDADALPGRDEAGECAVPFMPGEGAVGGDG